MNAANVILAGVWQGSLMIIIFNPVLDKIKHLQHTGIPSSGAKIIRPC